MNSGGAAKQCQSTFRSRPPDTSLAPSYLSSGPFKAALLEKMQESAGDVKADEKLMISISFCCSDNDLRSGSLQSRIKPIRLSAGPAEELPAGKLYSHVRRRRRCVCPGGPVSCSAFVRQPARLNAASPTAHFPVLTHHHLIPGIRNCLVQRNLLRIGFNWSFLTPPFAIFYAGQQAWETKDAPVWPSPPTAATLR